MATKPPYRWSTTSRGRLLTCDPRLQEVMNAVLQAGDMDVTILYGHRTEAEQNRMAEIGRSQLIWPRSKHNSTPSLAIDAAPYPIDWEDRERLTLFAGYVMGTARGMGIALRWGGDWDHDWRVKDNRFDDLVHFEIRKE